MGARGRRSQWRNRLARHRALGGRFLFWACPSCVVRRRTKGVHMYNEEERDLRRQLGVRLELSRRGQNLTLEEMQQRTQIWAHQLEALERGKFDMLPSPLWARGLLMKYANSLGLDGKALAEAYFPQSHPFQTIRRSEGRLRRRVAAPLKR